MHGPFHLRLFHGLAGLTGAEAGVCPEIPVPKPSEWAQSALNFQPGPRQADILDHEAHRLILCCSRQWGKTTVIAIKALHTAIFHPGAEIAVISRSLKQAGILIGRLCQSAAVLGYPRRRVPGHPLSLALPNGSNIFAIASTGSSGRGYTANIVIVDEAALVQDEVIAAASPTLGRTNGKLWLLSTPHGQSGLFYNVWHGESLNNWFRVRATIEDTPYVSPEFIEEQRRLFPLNFRQDFYCEFVPAKGRLLSAVRVGRIVDPAITHTPLPPLSEEIL